MVKKIMKRSEAFILAAALTMSMIVPQANVSAADQKMAKLQKQYFLQKSGVKNTTREATPEEWNKTEIKAYRFNGVTDALMYMMSGGIKYYNESYFKNPKKIKITIEDSGTLVLSALADDEKPGVLYDSDQKVIKKIEDESYVKAQVNKGEVYYVDFPTKCKQGMLSVYVLKNECQSLSGNDINLQRGQGKETYHTFQMKKRGSLGLVVSSLTEQGSTSYKIQKNEKGKWTTIGKTRIAKQEDAEENTYGISAGNYRLVLKASPEQVAGIGIEKDYYSKKKISYKKSKAKNLDAENIYTTNEKAARWYKVSVKTSKKQKKLGIYTSINDGGLKFTVYQKGKKKPVKTVKMKRSNFSKSVKLPKRRGTYYVKVSKLTKKTNGYYRITK